MFYQELVVELAPARDLPERVRSNVQEESDREPVCRAIALLLSASQFAAAWADDAGACVAKMSDFVAELDRLLSTQRTWIVPYGKLHRKYFPFADCDGDPLLIEASKSRFFQDIGYNPRSRYYVVSFSNGAVVTGFVYRAKERRAEANGVSWADK